jgi:hypothetical protein
MKKCNIEANFWTALLSFITEPTVAKTLGKFNVGYYLVNTI